MPSPRLSKPACGRTPRLPAGPLAALLLATLLAGCSSPPRPGSDGAEARPPARLIQVPDAVPRVEPQRSGGPNKPYVVLGQAYTPLTGDPVVVERGLASWYGRKFHGLPTSNGETYDMYAMTGAHKTMPLPSYARVRNPANGREVVLRINDRGPFHPDRVIDLSYTAALKLGVLGGVAPVEVERITHEAMHSGHWQAQGGRVAAAPLAAPPARTEPLALPSPAMAPTAMGSDAPAQAPATRQASAGYWLQFGAFRDAVGASGLAEQLRGQLQWLAPLLAIFSEHGLHRLQAGPYASRAEANTVAERLRAAELRLAPAIVERR